MSKKTQSFLKSMLAGLIIAILVVYVNAEQGYGLMRQLCDACFVPAVLLLGWGGIRWVTNQGAFDVLGYGVSSVFHVHVPGASIGQARDQEKLEDYRARKARKRKAPSGVLLAGLSYLAVAVVLMVLYTLAE